MITCHVCGRRLDSSEGVESEVGWLCGVCSSETAGVGIRYEGKRWRIYYYHIGDFEEDLQKFGAFLEKIEDGGEKVLAIVPNTGIVKTSLVLGTSFQGVKGFAVVSKKTEGATQGRR